jgi:hypothetical protein
MPRPDDATIGALRAKQADPTDTISDLFQMSILRPLRQTACVLLGCGLPLVIPSAARATEDTAITAVASKASPDYVRTKRADGSYQPETYAFGPGGFWGGMHDDSIDKLKFIDVARIVAGPLAAQNYLPTKDPDKTTLLIMVYWGLTTVPAPLSASAAFANVQTAQTNLQMALQERPPIPAAILAARDQLAFAQEALRSENRVRDQTDLENAKILGYGAELEAIARFEQTPFQYLRDELIEELEGNRYFVVLMAYDFQLMWKQKKHKLLWETRFSIRQIHNDFDKQLEAMAEHASQYFGQDTQGLIRKPIPEGNVKVGDLKVLGVEPEKK